MLPKECTHDATVGQHGSGGLRGSEGRGCGCRAPGGFGLGEQQRQPQGVVLSGTAGVREPLQHLYT